MQAVLCPGVCSPSKRGSPVPCNGDWLRMGGRHSTESHPLILYELLIMKSKGTLPGTSVRGSVMFRSPGRLHGTLATPMHTADCSCIYCSNGPRPAPGSASGCGRGRALRHLNSCMCAPPTKVQVWHRAVVMSQDTGGPAVWSGLQRCVMSCVPLSLGAALVILDPELSYYALV